MIGVTVLGSGSRGNALVLHNKTETLLIDAGFSGRELKRRLQGAEVDPQSIRAIVVSHEHTDHVRGLESFARRQEIPVYCNRMTGETLRQRGADLGQLYLFSAGTAFQVGDFHLEPFSIPHDAIDPVGFAVYSGNAKAGIATDLGHSSKLVSYHLADSDVLVVESNHDIELLHNSPRPWAVKQRILSRHGHLSNDASMDLLRETVSDNTRHVLLAHASQDCNKYELVERTVHSFFQNLGRSDVGLHVARQSEGLPTVWSGETGLV